MPSCLSVQWEPISSIGVAFRSGISVIAAITLITASPQQNKCNCHVCPSVQWNKCYNASFAKAPQWPHCTAVIETFQLVRICISKALKGAMVSVKNVIEHKIGSKVKVKIIWQKSLTPASGQTMVGFQSSFTRKSLMKSGLRSRLIVPESDFSSDQGVPIRAEELTHPVFCYQVTNYQNIATGETSQAITPFHFFDNLNFHH